MRTTYTLPSRLVTPDTADYSRLTFPRGPWDGDFWVVVPHSGDHRRNAAGPCQVDGCGRPPYYVQDADSVLCYAHYWQWRLDGQPTDVSEWARQSARPARQRMSYRRLNPRGIDFTSLPTPAALEIRSVVATKITRGDWSPNVFLLTTLELLVASLHKTGQQSFLDRRPEDWQLIARQIAEAKGILKTFDGTVRSTLTTFFATLHRSLIADPWADDRWLWRDGMGSLLGEDEGRSEQNINWGTIEIGWLRQSAKRLARRTLITKERSWATIAGWVKGLTLLSQFLIQEGAAEPCNLDRELFVDYLAWIREAHGSKTNLQLVNTVAAILETLRVDDIVPDLGAEVYLRRGENVIEKVRRPRPYPDDILKQIDSKIMADPDLDPTIRTMLRLTRWGGLRISELVTVPFDSLRHNGKGGYWMEYWMPKVKKWRRFPLPADLAKELLAQQDRVRKTYGQSAYMFPSWFRSNLSAQVVLPWSPSGMRDHVKGLFNKHGISQSAITGETVSGGEIHRYRHTVGTLLLNNGWSQAEVQEFLGHDSPTMVSAYAAITDDTLNRKAEEFHREQGLRGQHTAAASASNAGVERMRSRFAAVLSNGGCLLPADMKCDFRPAPCPTCSFFDPGGEEFAAVHANQRKQLRLLIAETDDAATKDLNQRMLDDLDQRIPEAPEGTE